MADLRPQRYTELAQDFRHEGSLMTAGIYYGAASDGWLASFWRLPEDLRDGYEPPANSPRFLGRAVQDQLAGALCFRLAAADQRLRIRCRRCALVLDELLEAGAFDGVPPRVGLLYEGLGDLRLFGKLGKHNAAYAKAATQYETAESVMGWQAEPEFDSLIRPLMELADSVGYGIGDDERTRISVKSLEARINYKRDHYPAIVDAVLDAGNWESDAF